MTALSSGRSLDPSIYATGHGTPGITGSGEHNGYRGTASPLEIGTRSKITRSRSAEKSTERSHRRASSG